MNLEELFTKLKNNKDNIEILEKTLDEINEKINTGEIVFNRTHTEEIYAYMLYCNKLENKDTLNKLINDKNFIKTLDNTNIDGSVIPSLTDICDKPRTNLMMYSKKLKDTILRENGLISTEEILKDLTPEEIKILRKDIEIDNYLISKGLSFSTLKDETLNRLLQDVNVFRLYNIYTINDFANSYKNKEQLINNEEFVTIYFEKLNDDYHYENKLFKHLNIDQVKKIISTSPGMHILLHLLKDTQGEIQKLLLKNKQVKDYLKNNINVEVLIKLPKEPLLEILKDKEELLSGVNIQILDYLTDKDLKKLYSENKHLYQELLNTISNQTDERLKRFINALPIKDLKQLCESFLHNMDLKTIQKLLKTENEHIRNSILKNVELCNNIINNTTAKTFKLFEDVLKTGKYTGEEIVRIINNVDEVKEDNILSKLVEIVPTSLRKDIYNNKIVREEVLKEPERKLDEYAIKHLIDNVDELKQQPAETITTVLNNSGLEFTEKVLEDERVLEKVFNNQEATNEIINIINVKRKLLPILRNEKVIELYTKYNIRNLLDNLTSKEQLDLCNNDLIKKLLNNQDESFNLYKKLANNNKYILNTVNFEFLSLPNVSEIKLTNLELITKYPSIQDDIVRINKHFNIIPNFINSLFYNATKLSFVDTISYCLTLIRKAAEGESRKLIGNIPKMLSTYEKELTKKEHISLISYLLYLIPRYRKEKGELVERPIILDTPNSFYDILSYEKNLELHLTDLIENGSLEEIKNNFLIKHFKLTEEEANIMLKMYSIDRLDNTIYKDEYNMLNNLYRIINTDSESLREMDKDYETMTMFESFAIEKQIKEMYGKIYNVEIRSKTYSNKPFVKTLYGKEIQLFSCPNDFLFLISNMDIEEELKYTNSYLEAWHNILNKSSNGISTSLVSNDNFVANKDIIFGFNGVLDSGIKSISNINRCIECKNNTKNKYMTPRELIDNTRDINNTIIIDRFALRPNYNNSNIPNIEPDFILADIKRIDDNQYLEMLSRASEEFKTKRNKNGLPIIVYDLDKISSNEVSKIKTQTKKYLKTYDMNILPTIITKLENNYTAYRTYNIDIANKFAIEELINIIKERINKSNSVSELSYIEDLLRKEYQKYLKLNKELSCNYNLKELLELIDSRKEIINN